MTIERLGLDVAPGGMTRRRREVPDCDDRFRARAEDGRVVLDRRTTHAGKPQAVVGRTAPSFAPDEARVLGAALLAAVAELDPWAGQAVSNSTWPR